MKEILKKLVVLVVTWEARLVLFRYKPRVVGVTGSVGKTTTKDAIAAVLSGSYSARASQKSFNSELGVPLTVLGCDTAWTSVIGWLRVMVRGMSLIFLSHEYPEWLVLEMGVDHPGDMRRLSKWVKLDVAVITLVGDTPVHVEFFDSPRELFNEKSLILKALKKKGVAVLGFDDEKVRGLAGVVKTRVYTFGHNAEADVHGDYYAVEYDKAGHPEGISFKVLWEGNVAPVRLHGILGEHIMYPVLAALTVGLSQGLNFVHMTEDLGLFKGPNGRMHLVEGMNGSTIIDDTYNSSPVAALQALQTLQKISIQGKKFVVLGDMMELGQHSVEAHASVGEEAASVADALICVGTRAAAIGEVARQKGLEDVTTFATATEAGAHIRERLASGDVVLIKGSQSIRLERAVELLMAHPERKTELLVRQGAEWEKR